MSDRIAVMSEGRVQQFGTPEDIYERPATSFVASFIGTANLMSGVYSRRRPHPRRRRRAARPARSTARNRATASASPSARRRSGSPTSSPTWSRPTASSRRPCTAAPTTTYLLEIAPGVEISVLEQNLDRARTEERWADGERVRDRLAARPQPRPSLTSHCIDTEGDFACPMTSSLSGPASPVSPPPATSPPPAPTCSSSRRAPASAAGSSRSPSRTAGSSSSAERWSATRTPPTSSWSPSSASPWCRATSPSRAS